MKNPGQNIALHIPLVRRECPQSDVEFLWRTGKQSEEPLFVVVNGVVFSPTKIRTREIIVQPEIKESSGKRSRVILSAYKRQKLCEEIDRRFQEMVENEPLLHKYEVYHRISERSLEWLGVFLGPRQVEGKHASYDKFLRNRRGKDKRF